MRELANVRQAQAMIILCALLAYATVLLGTFVYDDVHAVRDNVAIRALSNIPRFYFDVDLFSSIDCRMYRPVVLTSYAIDYAVGQGAAWTFKLTNLILHASVAVALYHVMARLKASPIAALLSGCLFAAHPLASEAVNTLSGRSELGVALFLLLGLLAHERARTDLRWALATTLCALLACGCKEIGVVLPALLLALDPPRWRRDGWARWFLRHALPAAAVLGYLLVRRALFGQATAAMPLLTGGSEPLAGHGRDLLTQMCTMATVLPRALAQCVVPFGLSLDPPVQFARSPASAQVVCGALFLGSVALLGLRGFAADRLRRVGLTIACGSALPWVVLPLNLPYLEHRMYVPLAGLAVVLAALVSSRLRSADLRRQSVPWRRVVGGLLLVFAAFATRRSLEYRDATSMWQRLVQNQPSSVPALCGLAVCHMEEGELAAALPLVRRAVALWPTHATALRNLAELNLKLAPSPGNAMNALIVADTLVRMAPTNPFDRLLRSRALAMAAEATAHTPWFEAAEQEALHCLSIAAPKSLVYRTAASARTRQGDHPRALALLDASVAAGLVNAAVLLDRVACLRRLGREREADVATQRLMHAYPFDPAVLDLLEQRVAAPLR